VPSTSEVSASAATALLSAAAVRERCGIVFAAAERGETRHFRLVLSRLDEAVRRVLDITRRRYPDLAVPYHSRWRHFSVGGVDRAALVAPDTDPAETARARIDLAIVSVLVDAGAGADWCFREVETGLVLSRSEGLAVASLRAMQAGLFSAEPAAPWRADAAALLQITFERLAHAFQHSVGNELLAVKGRAALLRSLGEVCIASPALFGSPARLGNLFDYWSVRRENLRADEILRTLLLAFGHPLDALSEPIVEWRALTIALLDRLASRVRDVLGKSPQEFPLACVLEGGTWAAGREIALERRPAGAAPLTVISDGTLF